MAIFNEILVGRFNKALQRAFGIKASAPVRQLGGEVLPIVPLFRGAEERYLESWERFGIVVPVAAGGAGNRAAVRISNPLSSNVVAVLEKVTVYNSAAADAPQLTMGVAPALATIATILSRFDARGRTTGNILISSSGNAGAVTGSNIGQYGVPLNGNQEWIITDIHELSLLPGDAYTLWTNNLNQAFTAGFWWRERYLEESERI